MANIQYPIAVRKSDNALVHSKDVANGKACNCYCAMCGEDMIAVNKERKQRSHFKHYKGSKCSGGYETYIHWLTKEVFKEIREIKLPPIVEIPTSEANLKFEEALQGLFNHYNVPQPFKDFCKASMLQDTSELFFNSVEIEEAFETEEGNIRVDIVVRKDNECLFIEPFVSHQVDSDKISKLRSLDNSAISIDLRKYSVSIDCLDSIEEFKTSLIHDLDCKKWEHIRKRKTDHLVKNEIKRIENLILTHLDEIQKYNDSCELIDRIEYERYNLRKKLRTLDDEYVAQTDIRNVLSFKWKSTKKEL